ncbi:MAG: DUF2442 domain-containing protein [Kiloniellales bacterium]
MSPYYAAISKTAVPTISECYGITIMMFYEDHDPPHFHARPDFTVEIEWGDGSRSVVDFAATIDKGGVFAALGDKDFFVKRLSIGGDGDWLSWPGEPDFSSDSLWYRSHPDEEVGEVTAGR